MDKKKAKIINMVPAIIDRSRTRHCRCEDRRFTLDPVNREVRCAECGNYVDPFDALMYLSEHWERIAKWEEREKEIVRQLAQYKPWKKAIKRLEENIGRKGDSLPCCPHCKKGFHIEEIQGFVSQTICENNGWAKKRE